MKAVDCLVGKAMRVCTCSLEELRSFLRRSEVGRSIRSLRSECYLKHMILSQMQIFLLASVCVWFGGCGGGIDCFLWGFFVVLICFLKHK